MSALAEVRESFAGGRTLTAWQRLAPLLAAGQAPDEVELLRLAYRTASRLGATTQRFWLTRRALRRHPGRSFGWSQRAFDLLRMGRGFEAWELLHRSDLPAPRDVDEALDLELARVRVHSELRDFESAENALARAKALGADPPRVLREEAWLALERDDPEAALALCRTGLARWPGESQLVEQECWLLQQQRDPAPALAALARATEPGESPYLDHLYASALFDVGRYGDARDRFARLAATRPFSRGMRSYAARMAARAARALGDDQGALALLEAGGLAEDPWAKSLRVHIGAGAAPGSGRRVLPVPYVRQDYVTCSPATMASLLAHAGVDVDQREIAAQITYDGTPSHKELDWAHSRGLEIQFFLFDPAVARELIDLGLPFAISTRQEQAAHRQALVGYDTVLGTFVLRDPGRSTLAEVEAESLAREIGIRGGDCALIVRAEDAARVPLARLPFVRETTVLQRLRRAYETRDLAAADALALDVENWAPSSARHEAELRIAHERGDRRSELALWQALYDAHPDDGYCRYHYAAELRRQSRWGELQALLERLDAAQSPFLAMMLAEHIRHAAPSRPRAEALARRSIRSLPQRAQPVRLLADVLWDDVAARPSAAAQYRLAACLAPLEEEFAWASFLAEVQLGEAERGLAFLRGRVAAHGAKAPDSRLTLARALERLHRRAEGLEVLDAALRTHDRPDVRTAFLEQLVADGQLERADTLIADAARWRPLDRERARLLVADTRGDLAGARAALAAAVELDGADPDLQLRRLRDLLAHEGRGAAFAELDRIVAAHGEDPNLLAELQRFCREFEDHPRAEALTRRMVAEHPHEHWLRGRLARHLLFTGRATEAEPIIAELLEVTPDSIAVWMDAIESARARGDLELAARRAAAAAARWPGEAVFLRQQRSLATSAEESAAAIRAALAAIVARVRPPSDSELDGLLDVAESEVPGAELDAALEALQAKFPGQPGVLRARARHLLGDEPARAAELSARLVAEHSFEPEHWLLDARCLKVSGQREAGRARLEALLERAPGTAQAWIDLGESFEQEGRTEAAMRAFERGLALVPTSSVLHGMRASLLWDLGRRTEAVAEVDRAAELDTGYGWARRMQVVWRAAEGDHDGALAAAQRCVQDNPRWTLAHDLMAVAYERLGRHDDRIASLRTALALDPRIGGARTRLLDALRDLKRFDEAEAVVAEGLALLGADPELELRRIELRQVRGELDEAHDDLRALLERHPDFERGWIRLLASLDEGHRDGELLALAEEPPEALREAPALFGYAADVHLRHGQYDKAEAALRRAIALAPAYEWGRDRLAQHLLDRGRHSDVLELFPGADDPALMPAFRAALLARAAAYSGRREFAVQAFLRLLRDPDPGFGALRAVDVALLAQEPAAQRARVLARLSASGEAHDVREHANAIVVLAARNEWPKFWAALDTFAAWVPAGERNLELAQLVRCAKLAGAKGELVPFVQRHLRTVASDPAAFGLVAYALGGPEGADALVELVGEDFRRPGMEGWMLANVASAYRERGQFEACGAVARYALEELPHDHSVWWHRRYLAEVAFELGDYAACREWCVMPTAEHPSVKVDVVQLDTLARMAVTPGWLARRRILSRAMPELLRQWRLADGDGSEPTRMLWRRFFRLHPSFRSLFLGCGAWGRRRLEPPEWAT